MSPRIPERRAGKRSILLLALAAILAGSVWAAAARRPRRPDGPAQAPALSTHAPTLAARLARGSILWVGAHPDDEIFAFPLLGELCVRRGASCTLLVLTRGEGGICRLPGGCHPDLAAVREKEMQQAAVLLGAELVQWSLPDGGAATPEGVLERWEAEAGSRALSRRLQDLLNQVKPDAVLTFDPRHGSTCHVDHRAAAELVRREIAARASAPELYFLETLLAGNLQTGNIHFRRAVPDDPAVLGFDARATWSFLLANAEAHRSQFDLLRREGSAFSLRPSVKCHSCRCRQLSPVRTSATKGSAEGSGVG